MIKYILFPAIAILSFTTAWAEEPAPIPKQNVMDVLSPDLNGDFYPDRVVLFQTDEGTAKVDFFIRSDDTNTLVYAATLAEPIWSGAMYGTTPGLDLNEAGSILVNSENSAIGRNRWEQIITIAYRNDALRVVGYTYNWYDTLDLDNSGQCDVNYLSGKASLKLGDAAKKWVDLSKPAQTVDVWSTDMIADICYPD
jgi:hypothetical protein